MLHNEFESASAAQTYFEKTLDKAAKVFTRGKKKDGTGKIVGQRAEVEIPSHGANKAGFAVVLTYGPHFYEILSGSRSFRDSRQLENFLTN